MRDYGEEPSLLSRLHEHLAQFDVLITYNGKAYDQPLLETRFRMCRAHGAPRHPVRPHAAPRPVIRRPAALEAAAG